MLASYQGDNNYKASSSGSIALTAAQGTPTVRLAASANPAVFGISVTLTATVAGSGLMPTGSVLFSDGRTHLCTATLNSSGVAACSSSALVVGPNSITAKYAGDSNYLAVTSPAYSLTVNLATPAIGLTESASSAPFGTAVTFTATLIGSGAEPTGTVTFLDGATQLGTANVNAGGVATYTTGMLALGAHTITASYGGSASYAGITSTAVTVAVVPATTTTLTISSAGAPVSTVASGSAVTLTAAVQSNGAPVTAGTVNFCDATAAHCTDIHLLGTAQLTPAGTASLKFIPGIGNHSYKAVFTGTGSWGRMLLPRRRWR